MKEIGVSEFPADFDFEYNERREMDKPRFVIERITEGFGFGEGPISGLEAEPEVLHAIDDAIEHNLDILVSIDTEDDGTIIEDDGCGDGRGVRKIFGFGRELKKSLNRAKVFGGAVAMAAAARIGIGLAANKNLNDVFEESIDELLAKNLDFGAHTADHVAKGRESLDSGCGAIDGAPNVIRAAVAHENEIRGVIKFLNINDEGLDEVFDNIKSYANSLPSQPEYSGLKVMRRIMKIGKIVKELVGPHRERRIVINTVRNHTVNQGLIRTITNDKAQIFAFDSWRLEDIATKLHPGDDKSQRKALLSELVYTLGVASVLTPGDMPVYMITAA